MREAASLSSIRSKKWRNWNVYMSERETPRGVPLLTKREEDTPGRVRAPPCPPKEKRKKKKVRGLPSLLPERGREERTAYCLIFNNQLGEDRSVRSQLSGHLPLREDRGINSSLYEGRSFSSYRSRKRGEGIKDFSTGPVLSVSIGTRRRGSGGHRRMLPNREPSGCCRPNEKRGTVMLVARKGEDGDGEVVMKNGREKKGEGGINSNPGRGGNLLAEGKRCNRLQSSCRGEGKKKDGTVFSRSRSVEEEEREGSLLSLEKGNDRWLQGSQRKKT